jgi:hypothetical protein
VKPTDQPADAPLCPYCSKALGKTGLAVGADPPAHARCVARIAALLQKMYCAICGKVIVGGGGWCRLPDREGIAHLTCLDSKRRTSR